MSVPEQTPQPQPAGAAIPAGTSSDPADLTETLGQLAAPELPPAHRRNLLRQLLGQLPRVRLWQPATALRRVTDSVGELAPHVPVRELAVLQQHHAGLTGDPLADRLVRNAARATAGIGAASGGLAAIKWTAPPTLIAAPALLCAETVAVVAVELKLIGELQAVYGAPVPDPGGARAMALLQAWAQQRGVNPMVPGGLSVALSTTTRKELAERLARRFGRNLPTLAPLFTGAAVASYLNQRATRSLGSQLRTELTRAVGAPGTA